MNGLLIVDKPKGYTSRDVVNVLESIFNTRKIGHAGTLDPIATGVLVIAVGNGLKILEFVNERDKEYIATVKVGIETNTLDISGDVVNKKDYFFLNPVRLQDAINSFKGKYYQTVPLYSSVKVSGQRLYKYARENVPVELPKREVEIYDIELLKFDQKEFTIRAKVSKGTYIRSLIRDIGEKIGIPCTMKELRRTRQGNFTIEDAVPLSTLEKGNIKLVPIDKALKELLLVEADEYLENRIKNGAVLNNYYAEKMVGFKNSKNEILAIYQVYDKDPSKIKPLKVFNKA